MQSIHTEKAVGDRESETSYFSGRWTTKFLGESLYHTLFIPPLPFIRFHVPRCAPRMEHVSSRLRKLFHSASTRKHIGVRLTGQLKLLVEARGRQAHDVLLLLYIFLRLRKLASNDDEKSDL